MERPDVDLDLSLLRCGTFSEQLGATSELKAYITALEQERAEARRLLERWMRSGWGLTMVDTAEKTRAFLGESHD